MAKLALYQRRHPSSNAVIHQVTGIAGSGFTWQVPESAVRGYQPAAGDAVRTPEGAWLTVTAAELSGGIWTLTCSGA